VQTIEAACSNETNRRRSRLYNLRFQKVVLLFGLLVLALLDEVLVHHREVLVGVTLLDQFSVHLYRARPQRKWRACDLGSVKRQIEVLAVQRGSEEQESEIP
jgi:hypothetical protein